VSVLPQVSGREVVAALVKAGYEKDRQRGSHIVMRQTATPHRRITITNHDEIAKGTLRAILRQAGITLEEFKLLL
jgi:predicted RNA binding protein YcfA (HicA-like mRNA interferase family)